MERYLMNYVMFPVKGKIILSYLLYTFIVSTDFRTLLATNSEFSNYRYMVIKFE